MQPQIRFQQTHSSVPFKFQIMTLQYKQPKAMPIYPAICSVL